MFHIAKSHTKVTFNSEEMNILDYIHSAELLRLITEMASSYIKEWMLFTNAIYL